MTMPDRSPFRTRAIRSPPQPAAAVSATGAVTAPPFASQVRRTNSPRVSWVATVQPLPSRFARSAGKVTATGASPAAYLSGWRTCSVDAGGFA